MLKLYAWNTPNGYKVPIALEELHLPYELIPVNISKGEQMSPEFLALNPNNKIPVLVDEDAEGGPLTIFESGAILEYLAEKTGALSPQDAHGKYRVREWLMFQMASVGPMFGQFFHFSRFAPEKIPYAIDRYTTEVQRLLNVMNTRLEEAEYLAGEYSIADIATWPWIRGVARTEAIPFDEFPNVQRWHAAIESRPAVQAALEKTDALAKS
jgi:GST-like protein